MKIVANLLIWTIASSHLLAQAKEPHTIHTVTESSKLQADQLVRSAMKTLMKSFATQTAKHSKSYQESECMSAMKLWRKGNQ